MHACTHAKGRLATLRRSGPTRSTPRCEVCPQTPSRAGERLGAFQDRPGLSWAGPVKTDRCFKRTGACMVGRREPRQTQARAAAGSRTASRIWSPLPPLGTTASVQPSPRAQRAFVSSDPLGKGNGELLGAPPGWWGEQGRGVMWELPCPCPSPTDQNPTVLSTWAPRGQKEQKPTFPFRSITWRQGRDSVRSRFLDFVACEVKSGRITVSE